MTDTLGSGDVEVGPSPRRRRTPRLFRVPPALAWTVGAVVVAVAVLIPQLKSHLADGAAGWLQREWQTAAGYDGSRQLIVAEAISHAATGDNTLLGDIVQTLDREEAARLRAVERAVSHHRTWTSDVHTATTAVHRALSAEASDLDRDANRAPTAFNLSFYVPTVESSGTVALVEQADKVVASTARRHGVAASGPAHVRLTSAASLLGVLDQVTLRPLNTRLVVQHDSNIDVWDLRTGIERRRISDVPVDEDAILLPRVGDSVLVVSNGHWTLIPLTGEGHITLPPADNYLAAADAGLWQVVKNRVRRLDAQGRPLGSFHVIPPGMAPPFTATADTVVLAKNSPEAGTFPYVWNPSTGRLVAVPRACDATVTGARDVVAYLTCAVNPDIEVMNVATGRITRLPAPKSLEVQPAAAFLLSFDGRRIAAQVAPPSADDPSQSDVAVFDVGARTSRVIPRPASPLAWSADGSVLVVDTEFAAPTPTQSNAPLAYWTDGMTNFAPLRIPDLGTGLRVVTAPPG